jgi:chromosomal replication initiation ATPase DnaA
LAINKKTLLNNAGWDLEKLIEYVCREIGVDNQSLLRKGRNNKISHARALVCYFAFKELCLSTSVIATRLAISQPAVSQSVKRGEILRENLKIELDS